MPDFFLAPCVQLNGNCQNEDVVCASAHTNIDFGLCDDPPPDEFPAYVQVYTPDAWIAHVHNPNGKNVTFKAIDKCVRIYRPNGEPARRCDGMLYYNNVIIFTELKDRDSSGWISEGRKQLRETILFFAQYHKVSDYVITVAYVANKQRPLAITGINGLVQKFKDDTHDILDNGGVLLKAERNIQI